MTSLLTNSLIPSSILLWGSITGLKVDPVRAKCGVYPFDVLNGLFIYLSTARNFPFFCERFSFIMT
jgi:hypothetical protein